VIVDAYVAYPALERVALNRKDPRLKPAWLLRYWYLVQELEPLVSREQLFAAWAVLGVTRGNMRQALVRGDGVYWDNHGKDVTVYSAEQLHACLEFRVERRIRPSAQLLLSTAAWHQSMAEDAILSYKLHNGKTDPITHAQIAQRTGLSRKTVQRHVRRSRKVNAVKQWITIPLSPTPENLEAVQKIHPRVHFQFLFHRQRKHLVQRVANRYRTGDRILDPGERETPLGVRLRAHAAVHETGVERVGDLWDGQGLAHLEKICYSVSTEGVYS
jgi:hypothetical protein